MNNNPGKALNTIFVKENTFMFALIPGPTPFI